MSMPYPTSTIVEDTSSNICENEGYSLVQSTIYVVIDNQAIKNTHTYQ